MRLNVCLWTAFLKWSISVLHRFRYLPGWWLRNSEVVGGLLEITVTWIIALLDDLFERNIFKVEKDGINCYECMPAIDGRFFGNNTHYGGVRIVRLGETSDPVDLCAHLISSDVGDYTKLRRRRIFTISFIGRQLKVYCHQSYLALLVCNFARSIIIVLWLRLFRTVFIIALVRCARRRRITTANCCVRYGISDLLRRWITEGLNSPARIRRRTNRWIIR